MTIGVMQRGLLYTKCNYNQPEYQMPIGEAVETVKVIRLVDYAIQESLNQCTQMEPDTGLLIPPKAALTSYLTTHYSFMHEFVQVTPTCILVGVDSDNLDDVESSERFWNLVTHAPMDIIGKTYNFGDPIQYNWVNCVD